MVCPICLNKEYKEIFYLDCGNFDNSSLYRHVYIVKCMECGHVYNLLSDKDLEGLREYYMFEYTKPNENMDGDRPGSSSAYSKMRYENIYRLMYPASKSNKILDIGCANGGFLKFLKEKGYKNLYGIDIGCFDYSSNIRNGDVCNIPFDDFTFDFVILDQVLEHVHDLQKAVNEIKRVLKNEGSLIVAVPDASKYNEFFDFYWFLLREHVQHFDMTHLELLFKDFFLEKKIRYETPMMSERMILPSIAIKFYLFKEKDVVAHKISKYLSKQKQKAKERIKLINELIYNKKKIYVYGLGREFLYLYELGLKNCNIVLLDDTEYKQSLTIDGKKIHNSSILKESTKEDFLIITATAHVDKIKERINFPGVVIDL